MSNVVNFSNFKRRELRCLIFEDFKKGEIVVAYENVEDLVNIIENPIEIYNPTPKQKKEILDTLKRKVEDNGEADLDGFTIVKTIIPMITNIKLDLNDDEIKNIVEDPSDIFLIVQDELSKIVESLVERFKKNIDSLKNLSPKELDIMLEKFVEKDKENNEELSEEELVIIEKAKKLGKI